MPNVIALQLHLAGGQPLKPVQQVKALLQQGLEGDSHSKRGVGRKRQVVLVDQSTLDDFGFAAGELREQITVQGLPNLSLMPVGQRMQIGQATLESAGECEPCLHIGDLLGADDNERFRLSLERRRGLLCRVVAVEGLGTICVGDEVRLLAGA